MPLGSALLVEGLPPGQAVSSERELWPVPVPLPVPVPAYRRSDVKVPVGGYESEQVVRWISAFVWVLRREVVLGRPLAQQL